MPATQVYDPKRNHMPTEFTQLRIGLAGIGLEAYWSQFEGLEARLQSYLAQVESNLTHPTRTIINLGLIDSPEKSLAAAHTARREDIDILLIYITTYALSSTILPVIQRAKVPVILLNLQPAPAIDYDRFNQMQDRTAMTGEWLAFCSACPVPEIANVLRRLDIPFQQVTGQLHHDPEAWSQLDDWLTAAHVAHTLAHSRLGLMGHYYSGMLDIATDLTQVSGRFGLHIEMLEVDQLTALRRHVSPQAIAETVAHFQTFFEIGPDCPQHELERAARTTVALQHLAAEQKLDLLAYFYKGTGVAENEDTLSSIILGASILTANHIPVAGEYEIKNVIAMKILDLFHAGGSFTEYYALDFAANHVLMGHDGPGHAGIAEDRIRVRPLRVYHGKVGSGLSVEMSVQYGPVTLLSIVEDKQNGFSLLCAEGESVPGPILEIGNTNSRYQFPLPARTFVETWNSHGPAHHCAIGTGHIAHKLKKLATLLNLTCTQIC
jgi:L-arabinose isomerase